MGATSVTGVSGPGSVAGNQKGSEHMSLSVKKLVGPHVVAAGTVTLSGTTGTIEIPEQTGTVAEYSVQLTSNSTTNAYVSTVMAAVDSSDSWSFVVTAGSGAVVYWSVLKNGL